MRNNIKNFGETLINKIESIDDLIDAYFEPVKDLTDTAADVFAPVKIVTSLYTSYKKIKFRNFLKAYSDKINARGGIDLEDSDKLKKYLKNQKNFNFLNSIIENAINSKSIYGSAILGYYAGEFLTSNRKITFKDLIIIEGVKELNDIELSCFVRIFNKADLSKKVHIGNLDLGPNLLLNELTIEKLSQLRLLHKDTSAYLDPSGKSNFHSTDIAEDIFIIIQDMNILQDLINYEI